MQRSNVSLLALDLCEPRDQEGIDSTNRSTERRVFYTAEKLRFLTICKWHILMDTWGSGLAFFPVVRETSELRTGVCRRFLAKERSGWVCFQWGPQARLWSRRNLLWLQCSSDGTTAWKILLLVFLASILYCLHIETALEQGDTVWLGCFLPLCIPFGLK